MRRSEALTVTIMCSHLEQPVAATRNAVNDKLVDCVKKGECARVTLNERGVEIRVYPQGCAVFRERT